MTGKTSRKRPVEETRGRQNRKAERGKRREAAQHRRQQANLLASKLTMHEIRDIQARNERGELPKTIAKSYPGLDEFTVARVIRYGKLTPWGVAEARRDKSRQHKRDDWAKRHGGGKDILPAGG